MRTPVKRIPPARGDSALGAVRGVAVTALAVAAKPAGPEMAFASTDITFGKPLDRVENFVGGTGGQLAAALAVGAALVGSVLRFNTMQLMGGLTVPRLKRYRQAVYWFAARAGQETPARNTPRMTGGRLLACPPAGLPIRFARSACFALSFAALSGCGLAEVEQARIETGEVARQVSALRAPHAGPRLSTVRLIERRPYVGLTRIEPDPRAGLPARFRRADAVTLPLSGIGAAAVLAGRIEAATGLAVRFTGPPRRTDETSDETAGDAPAHLLGEGPGETGCRRPAASGPVRSMHCSMPGPSPSATSGVSRRTARK